MSGVADRVTEYPDVVQVASSYAPNFGGVETIARGVAIRYRELARMSVVTNRWPPDLPSVETVDGVPVTRVGFPLPGRSLRNTLRWAADVRSADRVVRTVCAGAQVIHLQCAGPNTPYAVRAARKTGLPLVVSLHGELTMDATGIYRSAAMRRAWQQALSHAVVVTGCSQSVIDEAMDRFGPGLATSARVVANPVDVASVRTAPEAPARRPYVLVAARLVAVKGVDLLLEAMSELVATRPDLDLVVAGDGPERSSLERRSRALGLESRVRWLGGLPATEVHGLMRSASAVAVPSRAEPQGLVVLEAMAAGAPVVATSVGGIPETVEDGVTGLLTAPDARRLAAALERTLSDPSASAARVARASQYVRTRTWDGYLDALCACYAEAVAARRR